MGQVTYYLGVALITGWFFVNAYHCSFENKAAAEDLHQSYTKFYTWSEPQVRLRLEETPLRKFRLP